MLRKEHAIKAGDRVIQESKQKSKRREVRELLQFTFLDEKRK